MRVRSSRGFTFWELLICVAIIAILAAVIVINVSRYKGKARDAYRFVNVQDFTTALELYYSKFKKYPCGDSDAPYGGTADSSFSDGFLDGNIKPALTCTGDPKGGIYTEGFYPDWWPKDPSFDVTQRNYGYWYWVQADRQKYIMVFRVEVNPELMQGDGGVCNNYMEVGRFVGHFTAAEITQRVTWSQQPCNT